MSEDEQACAPREGWLLVDPQYGGLRPILVVAETSIRFRVAPHEPHGVISLHGPGPLLYRLPGAMALVPKSAVWFDLALAESIGLHVQGPPMGGEAWLSEPARLQWRTAAGLPGLIVRNHLGALCGYAAVNPGHALHGVNYALVELADSVHGGLTYSGPCQGEICYLPDPGEPDDVWLFGFDCSHPMDFVPAWAQGEPDRYRDLIYVIAEVEHLAEQLIGR